MSSRGLGSGSKDTGSLNADTWHRCPPRAALTLLGPPWGLAARPASSIMRPDGRQRCSLGLGTYPPSGLTPSVLDGGLPEWTDWLSPASVQECGSEEMNIQRARLWVLGAVQGAAEQAGPAWL